MCFSFFKSFNTNNTQATPEASTSTSSTLSLLSASKTLNRAVVDSDSTDSTNVGTENLEQNILHSSNDEESENSEDENQLKNQQPNRKVSKLHF